MLNGAQLGGDASLSGSDVGQEESERDEEGIQEGADQAGVDTMHVEEDDVVHFEERREDPDDGDVDDGEDDGPDEGERESQHCRDQSIQPEANLREDQEGQPPDELESLCSVRLGQDVIEAEVDVAVDPLVIAIENVQSGGEVLSRDERRGVLLLLFRLLHLLFLLSLLSGAVFSILSFGLQFDGVLVLARLPVVRLVQQGQSRLVQVSL